MSNKAVIRGGMADAWGSANMMNQLLRASPTVATYASASSIVPHQ